MLELIFGLLLGLISGSAKAFTGFVTQYGYTAIFGLMALESSSFPVPSEVILPFAGLLSAKGMLYFPYAFAVGLAGSIVGMAIDYYIAYFIGKDIVYKHLHAFHIKKETLDNFDVWFYRNGFWAVFVSRLLPVVRTFMSFPAGFARMDAKRFFAYSIGGSAIWNLALMLFGFYALSARRGIVVLASIALFAIVLYAAYKVAIGKIRKKG